MSERLAHRPGAMRVMQNIPIPGAQTSDLAMRQVADIIYELYEFGSKRKRGVSVPATNPCVSVGP